jgi:predicted HTH transcriptional regulator
MVGGLGGWAANKELNDQFATNLELLTEGGKYNYVAYLLADVNGNSIKLAKYNGLDRVSLSENDEYGYCSLVKATDLVLDRIKVENKTYATITYPKRIERQIWDYPAIREAVVNAILHNDYTSEVPPKFEFFEDRLEITSYGGLMPGMSKEEFFTGFSVPRNKELMRVFRDLDMVEQLGSGVPRILKSYGRECFTFTENFLRMSFPIALPLTDQVTDQVRELIKVMSGDMDREEIQRKLGLLHRGNFRTAYLKPALDAGFIEMTIPDKPNSRLQKYRLTVFGKRLKDK